MDGLLTRGFNQAPLRCITAYDVTKVLKKFMQDLLVSIKEARGYLSKLFILIMICLLWKAMRCPLLVDVKHVSPTANKLKPHLLNSMACLLHGPFHT